MVVSDASVRILAALLQARTGQQLAVSRRWRVESALQPLLRDRGGSLDDLVAALAREPALAEAVVEALLNNETFFYRDRPAFDLVLGPVLVRLERARAATKRLRIWCAGCSTGQEAYSIAMRIAEQKLRWQDWSIEIVGTDISRSTVARAREGLYSQFEVQRGLAVTQMMRWFAERPGQNWQLCDEIRRMVRFEVRSLLDLPPPPPTSFDLILCRNVLLYFCPDKRRTVFARLASAAAPDAVLMLGAGETVIGQTEAFVSDPDCRGLYVRALEPSRRAAAS